MSKDLFPILTDIATKMGSLEGGYKALDNKVTAIQNIQESHAEQSRLHTEQLNHQNNLLDEHIAGVKTQAKRLDVEKEIREAFAQDVEQRFSKLEEGPKLRSAFARTVIGGSKFITALSAIIAGIYGLSQLAT